MKLRELIKNLSIIEMNADAELEISGVSYDSRKTEKGDMFVAIRGFEADGHKFIPKAVENGAAVILDDTGGKYINFKLEFPKRKVGADGRK